jgi:hypothetical protein
MSSQALLSEIERAPEEIRREVWNFLKFLQSKSAVGKSSENSLQGTPDWSGVPAKWKSVWGEDHAPGSSMDSILDDLRGTR